MSIIDPANTWRLLEERLAATTNPRHRVVLEIVIQHMKAEFATNLDGLMATLAPNTDYHFWMQGQDVGPKTTQGVRDYYAAFVASRSNYLEFALDRLVVDDHCVVTEGYLRQLYPGEYAAALGFVDDPDGDYLIVMRQLLLWPIDENGLILGEDSYHSGPVEVTKLTRDQLPAAYIALVHADA